MPPENHTKIKQNQDEFFLTSFCSTLCTVIVWHTRTIHVPSTSGPLHMIFCLPKSSSSTLTSSPKTPIYFSDVSSKQYFLRALPQTPRLYDILLSYILTTPGTLLSEHLSKFQLYCYFSHYLIVSLTRLEAPTVPRTMSGFASAVFLSN